MSEAGKIGSAAAPALVASVLVLAAIAGAPVPSAAQTLQALHGFDPAHSHLGFYPIGRPMMGPHGRLYGTTSAGGAGCTSGCGTVYELTPDTSGVPMVYRRIHAFTGTNGDGADPHTGLILDGKGDLLGSADQSGATCWVATAWSSNGCGVVFMEVPPATTGGGWTHRVIHKFSGNFKDGAFPEAALLRDPTTGIVYGTTCAGGLYGAGTVFSLAPSGDGWSYAVIYDFQDGPDGACPEAPLTLGATDDVMYGTTFQGAADDAGTVFELSRGAHGWVHTVIYSFDPQDDAKPAGANPHMGVTLYKGDLFGTTQYDYTDGDNGFGTVFRLHLDGRQWTETPLLYFDFGGNGAWPQGDYLVVDNSGDLFGSAPSSDGGLYNAGVIYELINDGSGKYTYTQLHKFGAPGADNLGLHPLGDVMRDSSGHIYGVTRAGGAYATGKSNGGGTVFKLTP
jgi:uncharacterized repeat protein (TIGR03803 family)